MKKILIIKNDKIGDFMLAWPSIAMIKKSIPSVHVTIVVTKYTKDLAILCPWIDDIILDPIRNGRKRIRKKPTMDNISNICFTMEDIIKRQKGLVEIIKNKHFDVAINLSPTIYNALLIRRADIKYRIAPISNFRFLKMFYTDYVEQRRDSAIKPVYQYNLDIIRMLLRKINVCPVQYKAPYLRFDDSLLKKQKRKLVQILDLRTDLPWVMIHVGTDNAENMSIKNYAKLLQGIEKESQIVITAGSNDKDKAGQLYELVKRKGKDVSVYSENEGLIDFARSIACSHLFISGSTGPFHIAAAIDIPTICFSPITSRAAPVKWTCLNSKDRNLTFYFCHEEKSKKLQINTNHIEIDAVLQKVNPWLHRYLKSA